MAAHGLYQEVKQVKKNLYAIDRSKERERERGKDQEVEEKRGKREREKKMGRKKELSVKTRRLNVICRFTYSGTTQITR